MYSADSPGHSILKTEPILIFDLDGTALSVNSFPYWVIYMLTGHFAGLSKAKRLALSWRAAQILMKRKLLRQSHYRTKCRLQALWTQAVEQDASHSALGTLNALLRKHVRPNLESLLKKVAQGDADALLATSAAGEYAQELGKELGFTHVLTTPLCTDADRLENCGERKRDRVLSLLETLGWNNRPRIFLTDHKEDLPLIRECQRILWFGRYEEGEAMQARELQARIIVCSMMPETDILRLASGQ